MLNENVVHFYSFVYDPLFLSAFFSWFLAQIIKVFIDVLRKKKKKMKEALLPLLWTTGGMPSSHASVAAALTTSVGFQEGVTSPLFITLLFYGSIIIRDALGVRRSSGKQAIVLNRLGRILKKKLDIPFRPVKEVHGHTMAEVFVGMLLGFFISVAFYKL